MITDTGEKLKEKKLEKNMEVRLWTLSCKSPQENFYSIETGL